MNPSENLSLLLSLCHLPILDNRTTGGSLRPIFAVSTFASERVVRTFTRRQAEGLTFRLPWGVGSSKSFFGVAATRMYAIPSSSGSILWQVGCGWRPEASVAPWIPAFAGMTWG